MIRDKVTNYLCHADYSKIAEIGPDADKIKEIVYMIHNDSEYYDAMMKVVIAYLTLIPEDELKFMISLKMSKKTIDNIIKRFDNE